MGSFILNKSFYYIKKNHLQYTSFIGRMSYIEITIQKKLLWISYINLSLKQEAKNNLKILYVSLQNLNSFI